MQAEDLSILAPPGICDDKVHLVPADKYRLLRLVLRVMPTRGTQFLKEVGGVLPCLWPIEAFRAGEHDVRKVEFPIHSGGVARIEGCSEPVEALRCRPDKLGFGLL